MLVGNSLMRKLLLPSVFLIGLAIGVWAGYRFLAVPRLWLGAVGDSYLRQQYASLQGREAEYPEARAALEQYLQYLNAAKPVSDSWRPGENPWLDARGIQLEKTLTWANLAILHERNGNGSAADTAWQNAGRLAMEGKWKDPSRNHLREVMGRGDARPLPSRRSTRYRYAVASVHANCSAYCCGRCLLCNLGIRHREVATGATRAKPDRWRHLRYES